MTPYEPPGRSLPSRARLNPHVAEARRHSKHWARVMGVLACDHGSHTWSEEYCDAHDHALFCAYTYPRSSRAQLALMTDWHFWACYSSDRFHDIRISDIAAARTCLARLAVFMPINETCFTPTPRDPVERCLDDLWKRTIPGTSVGWRRHFCTSTQKLFEVSLSGPDQPGSEQQRQTSAAQWSAALVHTVVGADLPEIRPLHAVQNAFVDATRSRYDFLFSAPASHVLDDLLTSVLRDFDNAVAELPRILEEHRLDIAVRAGVMRYARALQEWQAGDHEWHLRSARFPKLARVPRFVRSDEMVRVPSPAPAEHEPAC